MDSTNKRTSSFPYSELYLTVKYSPNSFTRILNLVQFLVSISWTGFEGSYHKCHRIRSTQEKVPSWIPKILSRTFQNDSKKQVVDPPGAGPTIWFWNMISHYSPISIHNYCEWSHWKVTDRTSTMEDTRKNVLVSGLKYSSQLTVRPHFLFPMRERLDSWSRQGVNGFDPFIKRSEEVLKSTQEISIWFKKIALIYETNGKALVKSASLTKKKKMHVHTAEIG